MDSLLMATHWPVNLSHAENTFWWVRLPWLCPKARIYLSLFFLLLRIPFFVSIPFFWPTLFPFLDVGPCSVQQSIVDTSPLLTALSLAATMMSGLFFLIRIFHPFISIHFEFYFHVYLLPMSNDLFSRVTRRGARAGLVFFSSAEFILMMND